MEPTLNAESLASLPALVLDAIWSRLSFAARRNLRASCRNLRLLIDRDLLRTAVVPSYGFAADNSSLLSPVQLPPKVRCILKSASSQVHEFAVHATDGTVPTAFPRLSPVPLRQTRGPSELALTGNPANASPTASNFTTDRFQNLRALVLRGNVASYTPCPSFPAALQPFPRPTPASLLAPFTSTAASLSHLVLLDTALSLSERDIATIANAFPSLVSLQLLASPGHDVRAVVPPLIALCTCARLRSLGLDLGRSAVLSAGCRSSLGLLTQLTHLVLGLVDTSGDELEGPPSPLGSLGCCCASTSGMSCLKPQRHHHGHHHHLHYGCCLAHQAIMACSIQSQAPRPQVLQADGAAICCCNCVVAARVGGVEASLYTLARANLKSLELRFISFGSYHKRLLHAVAAGSVAAGCDNIFSRGGLEHLCLRLMPLQQHAAPTSASFAAGSGTGPGTGSIGTCFGGGPGDLGTPSASLSCGPLALGDTVAAPVAAVGWMQPSESELMLATLAALPTLHCLEVPELLLTTSHQLACLSTLTRLRKLRVGGVVAAGVPMGLAAPAGGGRRGSAVVLHGLRSLVIEAESPTYGGGGAAVAPWWLVVCPSLRHLSLTLQYGDAHGGLVPGGGRRNHQPAAEELAAALAHVADVRLIVCVTGRTAPMSTATGYSVVGGAGGGRTGGTGFAQPLQMELPFILRRCRTVRDLELHAADPMELLSCLSEDLLLNGAAAEPARLAVMVTAATGGDWHADGGAGVGPCHEAAAGAGEFGRAGVATLRLVTSGGWQASGPAATDAAGAGIASFCRLLTRIVRSASPSLECLCVSVPGLLVGATSCGVAQKGWRSCVKTHETEAVNPVKMLALAAAVQGTRLCLCSMGPEERGRLLLALERAGVQVVEGRCPGCLLERPVHVMVT
ncbi:hypothetical protein VaNZ11_002838 [Volvox africanus]|uniref:F-box domain-containing protein n=1 Tax=Volvox africanus TaxID=51714 RepID=A0ABQ5RT66_9CHLO|nr:hypothetical protein VaNZ11_002838 [Volvox africanus]